MCRKPKTLVEVEIRRQEKVTIPVGNTENTLLKSGFHCAQITARTSGSGLSHNAGFENLPRVKCFEGILCTFKKSADPRDYAWGLTYVWYRALHIAAIANSCLKNPDKPQYTKGLAYGGPANPHLLCHDKL